MSVAGSYPVVIIQLVVSRVPTSALVGAVPAPGPTAQPKLPTAESVVKLIMIGFQALAVRVVVVAADAPGGKIVILVAVDGNTETESAQAVLGLVFVR